MATPTLPGISAKCLRICLRAIRPEVKNGVRGCYACKRDSGHILNFVMVGLHCGEVNYVIKDAEGARKGRYGCTRGLIWVHVSGLLWVCNHKQYQPG